MFLIIKIAGEFLLVFIGHSMAVPSVALPLNYFNTMFACTRVTTTLCHVLASLYGR